MYTEKHPALVWVFFLWCIIMAMFNDSTKDPFDQWDEDEHSSSPDLDEDANELDIDDTYNDVDLY